MLHRSKFRKQALPLPSTVLALGIAGSAALNLWLCSPAELIKGFRRDAAILAYQVTSRAQTEVGERSAANYIEWVNGPVTLAGWTGFTGDWLSKNPDGVIGWLTRVRGGNTTYFDETVRWEYPDVEGDIQITRMSADGELVDIGDGISATCKGEEKEEEDMWPVLYTNPSNKHLVGYDIGSVPSSAKAITQMLETKKTSLTDVVTLADAELPGFSVFTPVFAADSSPSAGEIVGCTIKETRMQGFVADTLKAMEFLHRYPRAAVSVFLRVENDDGGASQDQLLFDLQTYPAYTTQTGQPGEVTLDVVVGRGSESFSWVVSLTAGKEIVVVSSFDPEANGAASGAVLVAGCVASLLVALLVYGRQVLMLSYKDGMEKAEVHSVLKSRFVADMSHEIRTPLTGIIGTAELLAEQKMPKEAAELIDTVQACSRILMSLVNDALDFSKIEAGELHVEARPVSLGHFLPEVVKVMRTTYRSPMGERVGNLRLRLEMAENVAMARVLADDARICQVLANFLSNAFKFTDSGFITVAARLEPIDELESPPSATAADEPVNKRYSPRSASVPDATEEQWTTTSASGCGAANPAAVRATRLSKAATFMHRATGGNGSDERPDGSAGESEAKAACNTPAGKTSPVYSRVGSDGTRGVLSSGWWRRRARGGKERGEGDGDAVFMRSLETPTHERATLVVEVTDTGVGMSRDQMDRLFKPFSQVHDGSDRVVGGTGLGLAICKSLCKIMGGTAGCVSKAGSGSTFFFSVLVGVERTTPVVHPYVAGNGTHSTSAGSASLAASTAIFSACPATKSEKRVETLGEESVALNIAQTRSRVASPLSLTPPCVTHEWNLATEESKYSMATDALVQDRHRVTSKQEVPEAWCERKASTAVNGARVGGGGAKAQLEVGDAGRSFTAAATRTRTAIMLAPSSEASCADVSVGRSLAELSLNDGVVAGDVPTERNGAQGQEEQIEQAASVGVERPRVLVADDFHTNRVLVLKMLEALDVEVEIAKDGAQAVEACRKSRFSVILMDVMMPVMDGVEAARAIRARGDGLNRTTPIVALTANPMLRAGGAGADGENDERVTDVLLKPITRRTLFHMVAKWASESEAKWMCDAWSRYRALRKASAMENEDQVRQTDLTDSQRLQT